MDSFGWNLKADPVVVSHEKLKRYGEGPYKSACPVCREGILAVHRSQVAPFQLLNRDHCCLCGQQIVYTDQFINGEPVLDVITKH
jgi:hypothetical protein